ncbi:hypothetical protein SCLCIDRAFT_1018149 [Scleroderma citrinum Foug A]|uniref:Uncharacterized protein n=1 Tax=Scleroderma citrinum Foug A TaxID=1036808 RepID=A0A0C3E696_9AGAM|nr:hypothetical protein SCLCIDRAFT_1018149 [Scleroderma citrinum Foug A]
MLGQGINSVSSFLFGTVPVEPCRHSHGGRASMRPHCSPESQAPWSGDRLVHLRNMHPITKEQSPPHQHPPASSQSDGRVPGTPEALRAMVRPTSN